MSENPEQLLHQAVRNNDTAAIEKLLSDGIDVNSVSEGMSPLDLALRIKSQKSALLLIERGGQLNSVGPNYGFALYAAVDTNNELVVKSMVENGSDVNQINPRGLTPLYYARTSEMSEILLANGANIYARTAGAGAEPIIFAVWLGNEDHLRSLIRHGANVRPEMVKILLAHGANVNAKTIAGKIPLHVDVSGKEMIVEEILKHGVEIDAKEDNGVTLLHCAVYCAEIVEMYLERGANINIKSNRGNTPLEVAQRRLREFQPTRDNVWLKENLQLTSEYIMRTIIRSRVAGLYVSKNNINMANSIMSQPNDGSDPAPNEQLHEYNQQCRLESYELRLKVGIYLRDFLATKYPSYISNTELCSRSENINNFDYPIYGDLILEKFERDQKRFMLLEPCRSLFTRSKIEPTLPEEMWKEILSNLSHTDLDGVLNGESLDLSSLPLRSQVVSGQT